jgi:colicin import membrane protein
MNAAVLEQYQEPTHLPSAVLAISVHVLLFAVLVFGVSWQSRAPEAVSVELWNLPPLQTPEPVKQEVVREPEPVVPPKLEQKPVPKVEPKPAPRVEPKPAPAPKKVDIVTDRDKKPIAEKKPAPKEAPPVKLDLAKQMKEQLARELETVQRERERSEVLSQFSKPAAAAPSPTVDPTYGNRIRQRIKPFITVPPDMAGNPEAIYDVEQLPTGEVLSVKMRKSSGNRAYDDAVERAILRASPLPRPERSDQFQRRLELKFRPND